MSVDPTIPVGRAGRDPVPAEVEHARAIQWAAGVLGPVVEVRELVGGWTSTMLALTGDAGRRAVLRLMTREPWRTHGGALTAREGETQRMLADSSVPAPRTLALDAHGDHCGVAAHLMSLLPGATDVTRVGEADLTALARQLAAVHEVPATRSIRDYQSWAWEAKFRVPPWARDAGVWRDAFAVLRTEPPAYRPCFIHRDFQPRNVLWDGDGVTGVVDWVETSIGPAWLDVAHCSTNIAVVHGDPAADSFAAAYVRQTGHEPAPYFDVMDIVGFLPPPGRRAFFTDSAPENRRLEDRLRLVLQRLHG